MKNQKKVKIKKTKSIDELVLIIFLFTALHPTSES